MSEEPGDGTTAASKAERTRERLRATALRHPAGLVPRGAPRTSGRRGRRAGVLAALGSAPVDPRLRVEIARLRAELLSPERIERTFRDRQAAMAREIRVLFGDRGAGELTAAVRAELVAGAVFAALAVWTEAPPPHDLVRLGELTAQALEQVRPALGDQ